MSEKTQTFFFQSPEYKWTLCCLYLGSSELSFPPPFHIELLLEYQALRFPFRNTKRKSSLSSQIDSWSTAGCLTTCICHRLLNETNLTVWWGELIDFVNERPHKDIIDKVKSDTKRCQLLIFSECLFFPHFRINSSPVINWENVYYQSCA